MRRWVLKALSALLAITVVHIACASDQRGLRGEYGFLSCAVLYPQPEEEARARVATMAKDYGIREFMLYDWFADYSTPARGEEWKDAFSRSRPISLATIRITLDEIHRQGGRAWAYVQAVAAEEVDLESSDADICKLRTNKGTWYWHPPDEKPRFPTYFANAAWARLMVKRWAPAVKELGFDGIHWDTLGPIAGDGPAEAAGLHAFLKTTHGALADYGLRQTMNFVDLHGWDRDLVRKYCEFPYVEAWSVGSENRYYAEMGAPGMQDLRGVLAMYPSVDKPEDWTETDVIAARRTEARKHNLVYVIVGDGERRMKGAYWPETVPLTAAERAFLRHGSPQ